MGNRICNEVSCSGRRDECVCALPHQSEISSHGALSRELGQHWMPSKHYSSSVASLTALCHLCSLPYHVMALPWPASQCQGTSAACLKVPQNLCGLAYHVPAPLWPPSQHHGTCVACLTMFQLLHGFQQPQTTII